MASVYILYSSLLDSFYVGSCKDFKIRLKIYSYFELNFQVQSACWYMVNLIKEDLIKDFSLSEFNIGTSMNLQVKQFLIVIFISFLIMTMMLKILEAV